MALFTVKQVHYKNIVSYDDIEIAKRGVTFICGESGCGKSTLLKLLNGVISPTSGHISYAGKALTDHDPIALRREVLLVSQSAYLFDRTVKENFDEYYSYRDLDAISAAAAEKYLDICCVNLPLSSMCNVLSGGEKQRVFLAVNLALPSKVVMLDEPTSALDDTNAHALMRNIITFCKEEEKTLLVVSHDTALAQGYADTVIRLPGGARGTGGAGNE